MQFRLNISEQFIHTINQTADIMIIASLGETILPQSHKMDLENRLWGVLRVHDFT